MFNLNEISGKRFTLLLTATFEGEDDWAVLPGVARLESGTLFIDRGPRPRFEVRPEWIDRIKPVDPPLRGIFRGADYYLALTVGHTDEVPGDLAPTGLRWPD
jgi:hypothetical protein